MIFEHPWALVGLLALPPILWLVIARHQRREILTGSIVLWERLRSWQRERGRKPRFRVTLLLVLLTAAAALLALAAGGPAVRAERPPRRVTIVLDRSPSLEGVWDSLIDRVAARIPPGVERADLVPVPPPERSGPLSGTPAEICARAREMGVASSRGRLREAILDEAAAVAGRPGRALIAAGLGLGALDLPEDVVMVGPGPGRGNAGIVRAAAEGDELLVAIANRSDVGARADLEADGKRVAGDLLLKPGEVREVVIPRPHAARLFVREGKNEFAGDDTIRVRGGIAVSPDTALDAVRSIVRSLGRDGGNPAALITTAAAAEPPKLPDLPETAERLILAGGGDVVDGGALMLGDPAAAGDPILDDFAIFLGASSGPVRALSPPPGARILLFAGKQPLVAAWRDREIRVVAVAAGGEFATANPKAFFVLWRSIIGEAPVDGVLDEAVSDLRESTPVAERPLVMDSSGALPLGAFVFLLALLALTLQWTVRR